MKSTLDIHWKVWCYNWCSNTLATWCKELTHWKRLWCWERLKAGGWDGWMASLTQWTWVWTNSRDSEGQGSLVCCSPWGGKGLDTTDWVNNNKTILTINSKTVLIIPTFLFYYYNPWAMCFMCFMVCGQPMDGRVPRMLREVLTPIKDFGMLGNRDSCANFSSVLEILSHKSVCQINGNIVEKVLYDFYVKPRL